LDALLASEAGQAAAAVDDLLANEREPMAGDFAPATAADLEAAEALEALLASEAGQAAAAVDDLLAIEPPATPASPAPQAPADRDERLRQYVEQLRLLGEQMQAEMGNELPAEPEPGDDEVRP
jgi:hypothetical protein